MSFEMFFRELEDIKTPNTSHPLCQCPSNGKGQVRIVKDGELTFSEPCGKNNPCFIICRDSRRFSSYGQNGTGLFRYQRSEKDKKIETRRFLERLIGEPSNSRNVIETSDF